jgi:hypothetical protein
MMMLQSKRIRRELEISEGGVLLGTLIGRNYYKTNSGLAICAFMDFGTSYRLPILVSESWASVTYNTNPPAATFSSLTSINYEGKVYFVSNNQYAMGQDAPTNNNYNLPILNEITGVNSYPHSAAGQQQAAKDLLDYYFGKV